MKTTLNFCIRNDKLIIVMIIAGTISYSSHRLLKRSKIVYRW